MVPADPAPRILVADDQPDVLQAIKLLLRGEPYGDGERCGNCLYYLNADDSISYCWHPQLRVLVGAQWWCQWWEAIPG